MRDKARSSPVADENVGWFEVAVHDAERVAVLQRSKDLLHDVRRVRVGQHDGRAAQQCAQVVTHVLVHKAPPCSPPM